jgi:hypothetical protein
MQPTFQGLIPPERIIQRMNKMEDQFYKAATGQCYNQFTKLARRDEVDAIVDHLTETNLHFWSSARWHPRP